LIETTEERVRRWARQEIVLANARELDRAGLLDDATRLYEQLVTEGYEHAQVYLRLAVIYRKAKRYDDEIRVMKRGLQVWCEHSNEDTDRPMKTKFRHRLEKVTAMRAKADDKKAM
jgi:lipopolysaccharide biosynthesis regulator YciM